MSIQRDDRHGSGDTKTESPTFAVLDAVAAHENVDPVDLPSLYEEVDTDALNAVCRSLTDGQVSFSYAGYDVTLRSDMDVEVDPL